jgi:hypothetical protein
LHICKHFFQLFSINPKLAFLADQLRSLHHIKRVISRRDPAQAMLAVFAPLLAFTVIHAITSSNVVSQPCV